MSQMTYGLDLKQVPVVDVHKDNLAQIWPSMIHAMHSACFIAIDIELSGLGDRKNLIAKSIDNRYVEISKTARSRSVLSFGLSCFKREPEGILSSGDESCHVTYCVQTFNVTVLCSKDYVVEPASLQFLVNHGFDFNKQYSLGIPYIPGDGEDKSVDTRPSVRLLFWEVIRSKKAVVIHNGLVDLVFLYYHFYTELPSSLSVFVADLYEMFPGGLYDTKQLFNETPLTAAKMVRIMLPKYAFDCVEYRDLSADKFVGLTRSDICKQYANHGWCPNDTRCELSHNVSAIVQADQFCKATSKKRKKKRTRADRRDDDDISAVEDIQAKSDSCMARAKHAQPSSTHRAGYDAFMTGFSMAVYLSTLKPTEEALEPVSAKDSPTRNDVNRICLTGKDQPLLIQKSHFAKPSTLHQELYYSYITAPSSPV